MPIPASVSWVIGKARVVGQVHGGTNVARQPTDRLGKHGIHRRVVQRQDPERI